MKNDMFYRKVFIEDKKENLPKEKGEYFAHRASDNRLLIFNRFIDSDLEFETSVWLRNVDWYLVPRFREEIIEILGKNCAKDESTMKFVNLITDELINN